jgi:ribosome-binding factor A
LRRQIGSRLRLRHAPELRFVYDDSVAGQDRIERILNELHAEAAPDAAPSDDPTPDDTE